MFPCTRPLFSLCLMMGMGLGSVTSREQLVLVRIDTFAGIKRCWHEETVHFVGVPPPPLFPHI
jgi:hypothetical protein